MFDLMKSLGLVGSSRQFMHKFVCRTDSDSARNALNTVSAANAIANHRWLCSAHEQRQLAEVFAAYAHCSVADATQHAVLTMSDFIPTLGVVDRVVTSVLMSQQFARSAK